MKIRKYGNEELNGGKELNFAVMIQHYNDETDKIEYRFITEVNRSIKQWKAENNKEAYLFDNRTSAQDLVVGLIYNGYYGFVVEVLCGKVKNAW